MFPSFFLVQKNQLRVSLLPAMLRSKLGCLQRHLPWSVTWNIADSKSIQNVHVPLIEWSIPMNPCQSCIFVQSNCLYAILRCLRQEQIVRIAWGKWTRFFISKFAMIHNDFVMLIRSNTAWLYSFLFHIHRIASARTAFDWQICTKETSKANKTVIFGYEFRELSAFTNVGFQSTQALITLGNKHNLATVLPPKLRPGKFTSKSPLEVETAMWYDLQAQN